MGFRMRTINHRLESVPSPSPARLLWGFYKYLKVNNWLWEVPGLCLMSLQTERSVRSLGKKHRGSFSLEPTPEWEAFCQELD